MVKGAEFREGLLTIMQAVFLLRSANHASQRAGAPPRPAAHLGSVPPPSEVPLPALLGQEAVPRHDETREGPLNLLRLETRRPWRRPSEARMHFHTCRRQARK